MSNSKYMRYTLEKDGRLTFLESGKKLELKEFRRENMHYIAPYSKSQAKRIANINGAFLSIK